MIDAAVTAARVRPVSARYFSLLPRVSRKLFAPRDPMIAYRAALRAADGPNAARHWPEAEACNADVLRVNPLRTEAWLAYGDALQGQGRSTEAATAYRTALDLEPENAIAIERLGAGLPDPSAFATKPFFDVDDLPIRSNERLRAPGSAIAKEPAGAAPRPAPPALVFLHLQKTGGMSIHAMLERYFHPAQVCPIRDDHLHLYASGKLAEFDLFSGHFDIGGLRLFPDRPVRTVTMLREPRARLISFYRFHVAHDISGEHGVNVFCQLANALSAEDFFEHERVRRAPEVFNHYLAAFGLTYHQLQTACRVDAARVTGGLVARAVHRLTRIDAIGLKPPARLVTRNETNRVGVRMKGRIPPPVESTPRLEAALEDLIRFDRVIYAAAKDEFARRLAQHRQARTLID